MTSTTNHRTGLGASDADSITLLGRSLAEGRFVRVALEPPVRRVQSQSGTPVGWSRSDEASSSSSAPARVA